MTTLRIHHRGYFFFWDLLDLWRSAHHHTVDGLTADDHIVDGLTVDPLIAR